ncbi:MAG: FAD-dependent oxidoreductase [Candidatus Methanomethylicia archaeon]|nr:FAD-dependent oxidoreductase [Candidatus Methanomethylicia archaeon]MCX8169047.1 FAD-dependent oxidoreductase [Candidatus Methanomethylicia archaeon]MDW7988779.1 FAD-dependent oxidoreductase [Nitrososphaerota archaeon]
MKKIVVIGFGPAGLRASLSAKAQDSSSSITVISEEPYLTYSRCGLPFVISGDIESFDKLMISKNIILRSNIELMLGFKAIDAISDTLYIENIKSGETKQLKFDSLIIATGSRVAIPPIKNLDKYLNSENVFTLRSIDDGIKILKLINKVKHLIIIGAGAIGLEAAEAFSKRGVMIDVIELMPKVLPTILDDDMALLIHENMIKHNIGLRLNSRVNEVFGSNRIEGVIVNNSNISCDSLLIATGVKSCVEFAKTINLELGSMAIKTNELQETSKANIYAAGDCAETRHLITSEPFVPYLGTVAYRQGNVAGVNAAGGFMRFQGALGSIVLKIFDYEVGATGLTVEKAENSGFKPVVGKVKWYTKAEYYPSHGDIIVKLVFDENTRRLIGGQIIGVSDVAQRVNILATAISLHATVDDLIKLDTCYSPPVADVIEPIVKASEIAFKKFRL